MPARARVKKNIDVAEREKEIEYNVKYVIEQIAQDQFRIPALIFGIPFCYIFFDSEKYKFLSIIELFVV